MHPVNPQPLASLRVVEFAHVIAGPFAGLQLQQLGAQVTKVEPPAGGDYLASLAHGQRAYAALNHAKAVRPIDLKTAAGLAEARALVEAADVLIDSYRPGVLQRLGLDYEAIAASRPGLIWCQVSGYGALASPALARRGTYDHVVQALAGPAMMSGRPGDGPVKVGFPLLDTAVGMQAAQAILAALLERQASGRGQFIEISLWRSALQLMYPMACAALTTGNEPPRMGNDAFTGSPGSRFFDCADGPLAVGANTPAMRARLAAALGLDAAAPDFGAALAAALRERPRAEAEALLHAHDVPVAPVQGLAAFLAWARDQGLLEPVEAGGVQTPGRGWRSFAPGAA